MTTQIPTAELAITDLKASIRRDALVYAVQAAEKAHRDSTVTELVSREAAILVVLEEAIAYWQLEVDPADRETGWREVAAALRGMVDEHAPSLVFSRVPADIRARRFAAVVADMRGPGDED